MYVIITDVCDIVLFSAAIIRQYNALISAYYNEVLAQ